MKKYQRLLLILISVISISLFLVYRHHYNRLHHVLEVFNFFGAPCNFSQLQQTEEILLEHDWGPQPLWQEVDAKVYVFSAFLVEKNQVQGIGVRNGSLAVPKTCLLHFENEDKPLKGKFTTRKIGEHKFTRFVIYNYTCSFLGNLKIPFSITFKSHTEWKHITSLITNASDRKISLNTTICVTPGNFTRKLLLEFLGFHSLLGVDSFIIYFEQNIPYELIKLLKNLSKILNMWITFLPYNLPLVIPDNFTNAVLEYDCHLRTKSHSQYSIVLGLNEYLVPSVDSKSVSLRLPIKRFCLSHVNKNRPMILQNFELIDDFNYNEIKKAHRNSENSNKLRKSPDIFESNCVIHRYEKCEKGPKTKTDLSVKRFSTDFTRSTLVQLLIHKEGDI